MTEFPIGVVSVDPKSGSSEPKDGGDASFNLYVV